MIYLTTVEDARRGSNFRWLPPTMSRGRLSDGATRVVETESTSGDGGGGDGDGVRVHGGQRDTYRIERVYLDSDQAARVCAGPQRHRAGSGRPPLGLLQRSWTFI